MAAEGAGDRVDTDLGGERRSAEASAGFSRKMVSRSIFLPFLTPFSTHSTVTQGCSRLHSVTTARWMRPSRRWIATPMPTRIVRKWGFEGFKGDRRRATGRHNRLAMANVGSARARPLGALVLGQQDLSPSRPEVLRALSALGSRHPGLAWGHSRHKGMDTRGGRSEGLQVKGEQTKSRLSSPLSVLLQRQLE